VTRFAAILLRLVLILCGYVCATLAASAVLHVFILGGMEWAPGELAFVAGSFLFSVPFVALFVGFFALAPGAVAILAAEIMGWRSFAYFAFAGAAAGLAIVFFYRFHNGVDSTLNPFAMSVALGTSGMAGGIVYWIVAGRGTGELISPTRSGS